MKHSYLILFVLFAGLAFIPFWYQDDIKKNVLPIDHAKKISEEKKRNNKQAQKEFTPEVISIKETTVVTDDKSEPATEEKQIVETPKKEVAEKPILGQKEIERLRKLFKEKKYEEAIGWIPGVPYGKFNDEAIAIFRDSSIAFSEIHRKKKNYSKAVSILQNFNDQHPGHVSLMETMAALWSEKDDVLKSIETYDQLISLSQDQALINDYTIKTKNAVNHHIEGLKKNNNWKGLVEFCEVILYRSEFNPDEVRFLKAFALHELKRYEESKIILEVLVYNDKFRDISQKLLKLAEHEIEKANKAALTPETEISNTEPTPEKKGIEVPITIRGNSIFVHAKLNEKENALLLLDTGASMIHLSSHIKSELMLRSFHSKRQFTTASGKIEAPITKLDSVDVSGAKVKDIEIAISDIFSKESGVDGILGMNFLKYFTFSIDHENRKLTLWPKKAKLK